MVGPGRAKRSLGERLKFLSTDESRVKGSRIPKIVGSRVQGTDDGRVKGFKGIDDSRS